MLEDCSWSLMFQAVWESVRCQFQWGEQCSASMMYIVVELARPVTLGPSILSFLSCSFDLSITYMHAHIFFNLPKYIRMIEFRISFDDINCCAVLHHDMLGIKFKMIKFNVTHTHTHTHKSIWKAENRLMKKWKKQALVPGSYPSVSTWWWTSLFFFPSHVV